LVELATLAGADPKTVLPGDVFELDLNGDGRMDRVAQLRKPTRHEGDQRWTFVLMAGERPRKLAEDGCEAQFVGAVDLDGDGRQEIVMLFQYQVVVFRSDGSVLVENAGCCGQG